jgi:hypothetical protein
MVRSRNGLTFFPKVRGHGSEEAIQFQGKTRDTPSEWRFPIVLSTAVCSVIDMTTIATASSSVLLFLLTAKHFL